MGLRQFPSTEVDVFINVCLFGGKEKTKLVKRLRGFEMGAKGNVGMVKSVKVKAKVKKRPEPKLKVEEARSKPKPKPRPKTVESKPKPKAGAKPVAKPKPEPVVKPKPELVAKPVAKVEKPKPRFERRPPWSWLGFGIVVLVLAILVGLALFAGLFGLKGLAAQPAPTNTPYPPSPTYTPLPTSTPYPVPPTPTMIPPEPTPTSVPEPSAESFATEPPVFTSTTKPAAMVSAIRVRLLMLKPVRYMTAKVPIKDSGTTMLGIAVAEALRRNR